MRVSSGLVSSVLLAAPVVLASNHQYGYESAVSGNSKNTATSADVFDGAKLSGADAAAAAALYGIPLDGGVGKPPPSAGPASSCGPGPALAPAAPALAPVSGKALVQTVTVGAGGELKFSPSEINAEVGSFVQFQFYPKNHSVVQSTFDKPCVPINSVQPEVPGFFSGFMPVAADATSNPVFTVEVKDTKPMWFYCSQGKHCQSGMAGVINPPKNAERTLAKYIEAAKSAPENKSPAMPTAPTTPIACPTEGKANGTSPLPPYSSPTLSTARVGAFPTNTTVLGPQATVSGSQRTFAPTAWTGLAGLAVVGLVASFAL